MLENHYLQLAKKRAKNSRKLIDDYTLEMTFDAFITREVMEVGISDFYDMSSICQSLAIKKFIAELDSYEFLELLDGNAKKSELGIEIQKLFRKAITPKTFERYINKRSYEVVLPIVQDCIESLVDKREQDQQDYTRDSATEDAIRVGKGVSCNR